MDELNDNVPTRAFLLVTTVLFALAFVNGLTDLKRGWDVDALQERVESLESGRMNSWKP